MFLASVAFPDLISFATRSNASSACSPTRWASSRRRSSHRSRAASVAARVFCAATVAIPVRCAHDRMVPLGMPVWRAGTTVFDVDREGLSLELGLVFASHGDHCASGMRPGRGPGLDVAALDDPLPGRVAGAYRRFCVLRDHVRDGLRPSLCALCGDTEKIPANREKHPTTFWDADGD
jgi:hypothetical protein